MENKHIAAGHDLLGDACSGQIAWNTGQLCQMENKHIAAEHNLQGDACSGQIAWNTGQLHHMENKHIATGHDLQGDACSGQPAWNAGQRQMKNKYAAAGHSLHGGALLLRSANLEHRSTMSNGKEACSVGHICKRGAGYAKLVSLPGYIQTHQAVNNMLEVELDMSR